LVLTVVADDYRLIGLSRTVLRFSDIGRKTKFFVPDLYLKYKLSMLPLEFRNSTCAQKLE